MLAKSGFDGGVTIDGLKIAELRFKDDTDLTNECYDQLKAMAVKMNTACLNWGLKIYAGKNKCICTSKEPEKMEIPFDSEIIE